MAKDTLQFDTYIKKIEVLFYFAGINFKSGKSKTSDRIRARCIYIFNSLIINHDLFGCIYWWVNSLRTDKDFVGITNTVSCITISILAQSKAFFLIKNEDRIKELTNNLRRLEMIDKQRDQSPEKDKIIEEETKFLTIVIKMLNILYVVMVTTFAIRPLFIIACKYYQTKVVELALPFLILYLFDVFQIKFWPFMYVHQCISEFVVSFDICSADYFFFTCCTYLRIQFRLLQHYLKNIIPVEINSNRRFVEDEDFKNNFNEFIKWHQELIELANVLEIIYSKSILVNFVSSSLIICLTGFNVTFVNDVAYVVSFMNFLFMSLLQVFFFCFFADLLMKSSTEISDAVYNSQWYMAESNIKKKLLIIMLRSQKPCKLTACGYADVNLNSFMRVLSTAWSYFALLQTMYGN